MNLIVLYAVYPAVKALIVNLKLKFNHKTFSNLTLQ